jgi:hypothetical protein
MTFLQKQMEWQHWGVIDCMEFAIYPFHFGISFAFWGSIQWRVICCSWCPCTCTRPYTAWLLQYYMASGFQPYYMWYIIEMDGFESIQLIGCGVWYLFIYFRITVIEQIFSSHSWMGHILFDVDKWFLFYYIIIITEYTWWKFASWIQRHVYFENELVCREYNLLNQSF